MKICYNIIMLRFQYLCIYSDLYHYFYEPLQLYDFNWLLTILNVAANGSNGSARSFGIEIQIAHIIKSI